MKLSVLLQNIITLDPNIDREISGLCLDSRQVKPNDLFVAVKGSVSDGRTFIDAALAQGAAGVITEQETLDNRIQLQNQKPIIAINDLRNKISAIAARFYDYPSRKLRILGVTGTNGKTSCTHFFAQALSLHLEKTCGIIGTLGFGFPQQHLKDMGLTTPDAVQLQEILHSFNAQGAEAVAMEVSSHSIHQKRVAAVDFEMGVFTNLSQDHLDYHNNMEAYASVKKSFLTEFPLKHVIINADDHHGAQWITEFKNQDALFVYGIKKPPRQIPGVYAERIQMTANGMSAQIHSPWGKGKLQSSLLGAFNLSNLLAVLSALGLYGVPFKQALEVLCEMKPVPGRMQRFGGGHKPTVIVDYSHTPDALAKALQALRIHTAGQLICVFGCGGDRDHAKRPLMAQIAEQCADIVIVTNDNPRSEIPAAIAEEIMAGFSNPEAVTIELDRSKAIRKSIQWAKSGDCILIAGKGAERYQQIGTEKIPFDDAEEVLKFL